MMTDKELLEKTAAVLEGFNSNQPDVGRALDARNLAHDLRALALRLDTTPPGWQLVPAMPTPEMIQAMEPCMASAKALMPLWWCRMLGAVPEGPK